MSQKILKRPIMSEKMKGKQHRLGKTLSSEAKAKRKERMGSKIESKQRIAIRDMETGIVYESISHAANALHLAISTITRALSVNKSLRSGKYFTKVMDESKAPVGF